MNSPTDEQIKSALGFPSDQSKYRDPVLQITREAGVVRIHGEQMYEHLPLNFTMLSALSELFGTKNIDETERSYSSGCESCDFGSCYSWTLEVKPNA